MSIVKAQTCRINRSSSALLICLRKFSVFRGQNVIWPADPQMTDPMSLAAAWDVDHARSWARSNEKNLQKLSEVLQNLSDFFHYCESSRYSQYLAFSVYEVVRLSCLSRSWFIFLYDFLYDSCHRKGIFSTKKSSNFWEKFIDRYVTNCFLYTFFTCVEEVEMGRG